MNNTNKKTKKDNRGGVRIPGPGKSLGAPKKVKGPVRPQPYLDTDTVIALSKLGNGNLSAGIRKSRKIAERLPSKVIAAIVPINDLKDPGAIDKILDEVLGE